VAWKAESREAQLQSKLGVFFSFSKPGPHHIKVIEEGGTLPDPPPLPVLEIDLSDPDVFRREAKIEGPSPMVLIIIRFRGAVVGQFEAPVEGGRIGWHAVQSVLGKLALAIWKQDAIRAAPVPQLSASVVVCTRDRRSDLERCLPTLEPFARAGHEILVVDNCPTTDETARLVAKYSGVRYVLEPRPGEGIARNRGLKEARGDIVAFTDDDAKADPNWLDALLRNFEDPMVALVTGITLSNELKSKAQIWFERSYGFQRGFLRREFDLTNFEPLAAGVLGASVNVAIRKSVLPDTGLFDEALGPGTECQSGADHEFFYRVLSRGYRAVYDPAALVWHRHRREWAALQRALYGYGVGVFAWWTRALVYEGEFGVLRIAPWYFFHHHVRNLLRSLFKRPGCYPLDLAYAEFSGALAGPREYFRARRRLSSERSRIPRRMPVAPAQDAAAAQRSGLQ
jgi:GT2 family glycosyltransferase